MRARSRKRLVTALLTLALVAAAVAVVWRLTWVAPAWWAPPDPDDVESAALADRVEFRLAEEAHKVRGDGEPWRLKITDQQCNAWLATRLPEWFAHAQGSPWPEQLGAPQVRFADGRVIVGVGIESEGRRRVVVASVEPRILDGKLNLAVQQVSMGRVPIPVGSIRSILARLNNAALDAALVDPDLAKAVQFLLGERSIDPDLRLQDGRLVRLLDLDCTQGAVIVECRTTLGRQRVRGSGFGVREGK